MTEPATLDHERSKRGDRVEGGLAVGVSLAAALVFWQRYHSAAPDPARFAPTDLANYYYPIAETVGRRLGAGELPLWNPASCSGVPLLATLQPGVLYPFTWLATLLPTADALFFGLLLQVLLAAAFAAAALRATGLHPAAAGLGGAFYVQACLLGNLAWPPSVATMTWLPLQWLCVEKLVRQPGVRWSAVLAVATALELLAGFPQYAVYGFWWLAPYAAVRLFEAGRASRRDLRRLAAPAGWMLAAVALGAGLAAAQLVPTAELAGQSARGRPLSIEEVHYLDLGTLPAQRIVANAFDPRPKNPTFDLKAGTGYLGVTGLFAVAAVLVLRLRAPTTLYLAGAGLLALLLSDGFQGFAAPLFALIHELPTGGLFRTPERLRFITMICAIALASGGLDALLRRREGRPTWHLVLAFALVALVFALAGLAFGFAGGEGLGWRLAVALPLVAVIAAGPAYPWIRRTATAAWVVFAVIDVGLATAPAGVLHAYPRELSERYRAGFRQARIDDEQLAELLALPGYARVEPHGFFPFHAAGDAFGLRRASCYEPLAPVQWRRLSEILSPDSKLRGSIASPDPERAPVFYDVASVARIVLPRRGRALVEENPDALPHAYRVGAAARATQEEAFLHIRDGSFDFARGVLLEVDPGPPAGDAGGLAAARILAYWPERVEVAVDADRDGWLVLTDTFYPGWRAEIDGRSAEILRANGLYRAVRVRAGDRRVVFEYRPASFTWGLGISGASLAAGALLFAHRLRRPHTNQQERETQSTQATQRGRGAL